MIFKPVEDPKELLSATQVAALLPDTTTQTVLRWAKQGLLPFVELPGGRSSRKYFRRSDIEVLLTPKVASGVESTGSGRRRRRPRRRLGEALLTPRAAPAAKSSLSPSAPAASAGSSSGGGVR